MKISTILLIVVLILVLYYYTAQTFQVVEIVGKHVYAIVKELTHNTNEPAHQEDVSSNILERAVEKIKEVFG